MCLLSAALSFPLMSPALSGFPSELSIAFLKWAGVRNVVKPGGEVEGWMLSGSFIDSVFQLSITR